MDGPVFLSSEEVRGLATPAAFVTAVRSGYEQRGRGAPANTRWRLTRTDPGGMVTGYAAILPETGVMGGYFYVAGFASGTSWFATPLFDADSGQPLAIIDGAWMNPFKTGATGAVAADALARTDASSIGLIGSGPQAAGQLQTTVTVRDIESVSVYSPTTEHRRTFAAEFDDKLSANVEAVGSAKAAVNGADIVITATTSETPVFDGAALSPGTHVTAMGQYHPKRREIDAETVAKSRYVIDLTERLEQDAGAYQLAKAEGAIEAGHVHGELGDVLVGSIPGRTDPHQITVFDSGGTGIETVAGAQLLYRQARESDLGTELAWGRGDEWLTGRL